ncbi:YTH domain-containing family 3-like isoform X1 [Olea europaea subsp. europaea]|uniref:YTH domain-containing family protein n=1 Tax=Olea europaea subsp. europaea TaxID=158383 RepID=A0A8S0SA56_OLEEU|nr:YTH domain-containing family 3-like isoform X1 [Olea europaea subsp. europaea]
MVINIIKKKLVPQMQGAESNSQITSPLLEQFETMYNEGVPECVVNQGLYYPTATNYGYVCSAFESSGDWDDPHRIFGLDGQEIQYTGAPNESLPYVYYIPGYGYAQSSYNPYNPYIPGAMMGVDGSFVGAQQYYSLPSYENPVPSPVYIPMIANSTTDPFVHNDSSANRTDAPALKHNLFSKSPQFSPTPLGTASSPINSIIQLSEEPKANPGSSKQPMTQGSVTSRSYPSSASSKIPQGKKAVVMENISNGKALSSQSHLKNTLPSGNGVSGFGPSNYAQAPLDKVKPKVLYGRAQDDIKVSADALTEQNRGPRTHKLKNQLVVKAYTTSVGDFDAQGNITIYTDQYNKGDFPVDYTNAKFFVIKSYSEDDVHKSIKYNVWSSTPNGNRKLNSAYEDAQRIAAADSRGCNIFLFFSVNASGQFCGVAEMTGPVDFHKDMDFWQQDKWSGSFPVKWHIIKDVPNPNFRHVILENNENKPVTNSRDTQEIHYKKGIEMLKIFKNYISKTSLLDDFMYYENRQKILQEEKARLLVKKYENPYLVPLMDPLRNLNPILDPSANEDRKVVLHDDSSSSNKNVTYSNEEVSMHAVSADGKPSIDVELKISSLKINPKESDSLCSVPDTDSKANTEPIDVVTVGSLPVKVNSSTGSSGFLTVGTIPLDPRALQLDDDCYLSKNGS